MADKSIADLVAAIMQPATPTAATAPTDPTALLVAMMQQQMAMQQAQMAQEREQRQREAEERRAADDRRMQMMMTAATTILPKLLEKPAMDPFMMKLLDSSSNKEAMQQFMQAQAALNQQSSQMFMQQVMTMFTGAGEMQSRMAEKQFELMEERLAKLAERDDEGGDGEDGIMGIIKAALPALLGPKAAPVAQAAVQAVAHNPAPASQVPAVVAQPVPVEHPPALKRKIRIMQLAMVLQQKGTTLAPDRAQAFKAKLVELIARDNETATAILGDDTAALMTALQPATVAEPPLGTWIAGPVAQQFVMQLIADVVKPGLLALAQEIQRRRQAAEVPPAAPAPEAPAAAPVVPPAASSEPEVLDPAAVRGVA